MEQLHHIVTAEAQKLELSGLDNARELGGYRTLDGTTVKKGLLLRSAALDTAASGDFDTLADRYHLSHVIDFRTSYEASASPEPVLPGVTNHWLKIIDETQMAQQGKVVSGDAAKGQSDPIAKLHGFIQSGILSDRMYISFLQSEQGRQGYRAFFRILLHNEEGQAVLWHCTSGKDRTGIAAMLLLSALNVDEDTVLADFLLTNQFFAKEIAYMRSRLEARVTDPQMLEDMLVASKGVSQSYLTNAIQYLKERYGSVVGYIKTELELTDADIARLKRLYTE